MLPRAIAAHNDIPGDSGFSPHQLLFGLERLGRGPGLPTEHESEDMVAFMDRMRSIDELVADRLRSAHEACKATYNKKRLEPHHYRVNDRCWFEKNPFVAQGTAKVPRALQNRGHRGAGDLQS